MNIKKITGGAVGGLLRYAPTKIVPAVIAVLTIPFFTRALSVESFGYYALFTAYLSILGSIHISWASSLVIRFHVDIPRPHFLSIFARYFFWITFAVLVLWLVIVFTHEKKADSGALLLLGITWLAANAAFEYQASWVRTADDPKLLGAIFIGKSLLAFSASWLLIVFFGYGWKVIFATQAAAMLVISGLLVVFSKKPRVMPLDQPDSEPAEVIKYILPALGIGLCAIAISSVDRFFIDDYLGAEGVAIYSAAYGISEKSIFFINSLFILASTVTVVRLFKDSTKESVNLYLRNLTSIYLIIVIPIFWVVLNFGTFIVGVLLPESYSGADLIFKIVAFSSICVGIVHRYSILLTIHNKIAQNLFIMLLVLLINVMFCLFLIPSFGLMGAAIATLISHVAWIFLTYASVRHLSPYDFPWRLSMVLILMVAIIDVLCSGISSLAELHGFAEVLVELSIFIFIYLLSLYVVFYSLDRDRVGI